MGDIVNVDFRKKKKSVPDSCNTINGRNVGINTECFGYKWINITPTGFFAIVEQNNLPFPFPPDHDDFPRFA